MIVKRLWRLGRAAVGDLARFGEGGMPASFDRSGSHGGGAGWRPARPRPDGGPDPSKLEDALKLVYNFVARDPLKLE